jgi:hypothetical protein
MICPVGVIQTESRLELPTIRKTLGGVRGGYTNPRMSNVIDEAGGVTETLYRVEKLLTGTTVVVAPPLDVSTVTHIVLPLNQRWRCDPSAQRPRARSRSPPQSPREPP